MSKSFGNYIMIDPEEIPTKKQLQSTIARLEKTIEILTKLPNDKWPVKDLKITVSYLKLLMTRIV